MRAASSRREHALQFGLHVRDALALRHRVPLGPPRDAIGKPAHHVDRDQQTKIARRRREILPGAGRLEDRRAVRHVGVAAPAVLELPPVFDGGDARLHLLFERRDRLLHRAQRIERLGRHHLIHSIVKILDTELRLFERKIAVLRIFRDFRVGQPPQRAVLLAHDRPEVLEAGAAERGIVREQEIAAPKTLARDRPVGLGVDGEEDARRAVRLRHAPHQHQDVPVRIGIHGSRAQRLLGQRHGIKIGVVVARRRPHGSGMDDVADGRANIRRTIAASPSGFGAARRQRALRRGESSRRGRLGKHLQQAGDGAGGGSGSGPARRCVRLFGRRRRTGLLGMLNVEPLVALRRRAAAAARAIRIAERQSHLECEIRAQKVDEVGAVGANGPDHVVFAETQIVEQEIARAVAQHFMPAPSTTAPRRAARRTASRSMRKTRFSVVAVPGIAHRPDAALDLRAARRRFVRAHGDFARDRAALGRRVVARERRVPRPHGRRGDLGEPEIGRPAVPLARFGRDASIGRDQRQLALERLLRGEDDAQRRALPRRERRGQDRELGRVFAAARCAFGQRVRGREEEDEKCACDQRQCRRRSGKLACWKQLRPLSSPRVGTPRAPFAPRRRGRIAGYRIRQDQSAGITAILRPAGRWPRLRPRRRSRPRPANHPTGAVRRRRPEPGRSHSRIPGCRTDKPRRRLLPACPGGRAGCSASSRPASAYRGRP